VCVCVVVSCVLWYCSCCVFVCVTYFSFRSWRGVAARSTSQLCEASKLVLIQLLIGCSHSQTVYTTKGTRAHTHRELIRKWPGVNPRIHLGAWGGVDAATLVAALGAGPPPPECRWGRRPHRGATACPETKKQSPTSGARVNHSLHK